MGVVAAGAFAWGVDWVAVTAVMATADPAWMALAVAVMAGSVGTHAARYAVLVGHLTPRPSTMLWWDSNAILAAGNTLLPLRAGNVLRPLLVARDGGAALPPLFFALLPELLCDVFAVIAVLAAGLALAPPGTSPQVAALAIPLGSLAVGALGVLLALGTRGARGVAVRLMRLSPSRRFRHWALARFDELTSALAPVGKLRRLAAALFWSVAGWATWAIALDATLRAVGHPLDPGIVLVLVATLAASTVVPQAPGFLGTFQVLVAGALVAWKVPEATADAVALLGWAVLFLPPTLIGLFSAWRRGMSLRESG